MKWISHRELRKVLTARGVDVPPPPRASTNRPDLEGQWLSLWSMLGHPEPGRQHHFHPVRKWAFDFAWPGSKVAVEIQGGIWSNGGHTRGAQYAKDREKMFSAGELGWLVYEVTNVKDARLMDRIAAQIRARKSP